VYLCQDIYSFDCQCSKRNRYLDTAVIQLFYEIHRQTNMWWWVWKYT